jgi:hypothetical protein
MLMGVVKFIAEDVTPLVPVNWLTAPSKCLSLWPDFKDTARVTKAAKYQGEPETTLTEYEWCSELYSRSGMEKHKFCNIEIYFNLLLQTKIVPC